MLTTAGAQFIASIIAGDPVSNVGVYLLHTDANINYIPNVGEMSLLDLNSNSTLWQAPPTGLEVGEYVVRCPACSFEYTDTSLYLYVRRTSGIYDVWSETSLTIPADETWPIWLVGLFYNQYPIVYNDSSSAAYDVPIGTWDLRGDEIAASSGIIKLELTIQ